MASSVVCIHPSADVSGTVRSAEIARSDFPGRDIRIIDTRTIAGPLASMVLEADRLAKAGASADEVEAHVRSMMPRARIYFLVDTLEFLQRGGRIGGAQALLGSILQIKPILTFTDGRIDQFEKERTKKRALARIKELILAEAARGPDAHLTIMHTGAPDEAAALANDFKAALGTSEVGIMNLVPAIVTHAGPGALALVFHAEVRRRFLVRTQQCRITRASVSKRCPSTVYLPSLLPRALSWGIIMTLIIRKLDTSSRRDVNRFIDLPFRIYRDCPQWVPPLVDDVKLMLNRKKYPFYEHSDADFFVAEREDRTGRPHRRAGEPPLQRTCP